MIVSHRCRFVLFPDPMGACPWVERALEPWCDQPIGRDKGTGSYFFRGMSPAEAELAFDMAGFAFRTYTRIAIIRNPYTKMAQIYDRIAATDRMWRMRRRIGAGNPDFAGWLRNTRSNGNGAAMTGGPRWRRFGAWSAEDWCSDRITHIVRAEMAEIELPKIFSEIGISPAVGGHAIDTLRLEQPVASRYDIASSTLIRDRYQWDLRLYDGQDADLQMVA